MAAGENRARRALWTFVGAVVVASTAVVLVAPASAQALTPSLLIERTSAAVGETLGVAGFGWAPDELIQVELCGNLGLNGSTDCAVASGVTVAATPEGTWFTPLTVAAPPKPCPCVVSARSVEGAQTVVAEVKIAGAQQAAPAPEEEPAATIADHLVVVDASIVGSGPPLSWFGGAPAREVVLTVQNAGTRPMRQLSIDVAQGKTPDPATRGTVWVIDAIGPGERRTVHLPLSIGAFAIGTYRVDGMVGGTVPFDASTTTFPWGLLALMVVAVLMVAVALVARSRRLSRDAAVVAGARTPSPPSDAESAVAPETAGTSVPTRPPSRPSVVVDHQLLQGDLAEVLVAEIRRHAAAQGGRPPTDRELRTMIGEVVDRVAATAGLDAATSAVLREALARELAEAFAPAPPR